MSDFKLKANTTLLNVTTRKKITVQKVTLSEVITQENKSIPLMNILSLMRDRVLVPCKA